MVARRKTVVRPKRRTATRTKTAYAPRTRRLKPKARRYVAPGNHIVPLREFVKMKYVSTRMMASTVTPFINSWQFQSSVFDPDQTGAGHQPYLHDQWATLFSYYRVWGMKYDIKIVNTSNTPVRLALLHVGTTQSWDATNMDVNIERSITKRQYYLGTQDRSNVTIKGYASVPRVEGMSKQEFIGESSYEVGFGSNPAKMISVAILAEGMNSWTTQVFITITFYAELWGRKVQIQS